MAISFPPSPQADGTTYSYNGVTYVYALASDQWIVQGTGSSDLYVLKTGDTMTGKLTGTTADFSGNVDIGGGNIQLNADGSTEAHGRSVFGTGLTSTQSVITVGASLNDVNRTVDIKRDGSANFASAVAFGTSKIADQGCIYVQNGDGSNRTVDIKKDGSATFAGQFFTPQTFIDTSPDTPNVNVTSAGRLQRGGVSSRRFKTDIETLEDLYADKLLECRPVWYRSTCEGADPNKSYYGFIAEEVAEIDPRLVGWSYADDGTPQAETVNYPNMVPHLVNLIKRQNTRIEALEAQLSQLTTTGGASS